MQANSQTTIPTGVAPRENRPFLFLSPRPVSPTGIAIDASDLALLQERIIDDVPLLMRSLVHYTLTLQRRAGVDAGITPPPISVLNRRRRSARSWILAIAAGKTDSATLHALAHVWAPQLSGTGPDLADCLRTVRSSVEFLRGAICALVFAESKDNLLPEARALHALEAVLSAHLGAVQDAARRSTRI